MYIDANHTWGWGMKHCTMFDKDSNLGWKGYFTKTNKQNYFNWYRKDITRNNNQNTEDDSYYCEERQYKYIISPNPNKKNMTPKFNVEG